MEITRLFDILDRYLEKFPTQDAAFASKHNGEWKKISIQDYVEQANLISYGLLAIGINKGDRIGLVSGNRPEWNMIDAAIMQIGAVSVPIYPTISQDDYRHILNHAEMRAIFIDGKELKLKLQPILSDVKGLEHIYTFTELGEEYETLAALKELGRQNVQVEKVNRLKAGVKPDDLATIIYTSGTTGAQKGVMLSHANIVNQVHGLKHIPATWSNRAFSFLPLCHAYERMLVYLYQYLGMSVYYAENLGTIAANIKEVNPTMMSTVPRVMEKFYDKLYQAGQKQAGFKKKLYYWAFDLATKFKIEGNSPLMKMQLKIADKLIYSKWREAIGGNFDIVVSGGSAIQSHMVSFFSAIGMPVFEGYGLSETSPVITVNQRGSDTRMAGTVGIALEGVEVKLGEKDEVVCKGHNVMLGYFKDPELTAEVIDKDGWFHTGDTGRFTDGGLLVITGRLKSLFKTSFGKYVNPDAIEAKFTESPYIENMIVVGENQKFAAAIIVPNAENLRDWCKSQAIDCKNLDEALKDPKLVDLFRNEVNHYNQFFGDYEQVKRYRFVLDEWTPANDMLSPTLKLKRKVVQAHYADIIEKMFA